MTNTLPRFNWIRLHLFSLYLFSLASVLYAMVKIKALADVYGSPLTAIGQNITLLGFCCFFFLFMSLMATREPNKATFSTVGAILTALVI